MRDNLKFGAEREKLCTGECKQWKAIDKFTPRQGVCRACKREQGRVERAAEKAKSRGFIAAMAKPLSSLRLLL